MTDEKELKRKAKRRIDQMDEKELRRKKKDEGRLKRWLKSVLGEAWDVIKGAIGGFLSKIFGI